MEEIKIKVINDKSPYLETVIELGDANKGTLSFLPRGVFLSHASKGLILVALDNKNKCVGYLMYRIAKREHKIKLLHLCIDPEYRGKKIARKLFEFLKSITQDYRGISLECRRDYNIHGMWEKLGFIALSERKAKTKDRLLTYWCYDFGHRNLFSFNYEQTLKSILCIIIDCKIFQEIYLESKALFPDWLESSLNLFITDEVFNYINNLENKAIRQKLKDYASNLDSIAYNQDRFIDICDKLQKFCDNYQLNLVEYELRHLGKAIASDLVIFVTCNDSLLKVANAFYEQFRLSVKSPEEIIIQQEDLLNDKPEYQPIRLARSQLKKYQLTPGEEQDLEKYFIHDKNETPALFQQQLRLFLNESSKFECNLITRENFPIALVVYKKDKQHELEITLIRIKDCDLASTLAHHLIYSAILRSIEENKQFTKITDSYLQDVVVTAIKSDHFFQFKDSYFRANISIVNTRKNIANYLKKLTNELSKEYNCCNQYADSLLTKYEETDIQPLLLAESYFFPAKIIDAEIPTFIIPIKPLWASQLFDENLANQSLFGTVNTELALNIEAVYYKSKYGAKQLKPGISGRILWYVSNNYRKNRGFSYVGCIRACSRLEEVIIGKPQDLYHRFRDLGIYEFKDIYEVAKNDLGKDIMAIKFSKTELFYNLIYLPKIQETLKNKTSIQSPVFINKDAFSIIYSLGTNRLLN